MDARFLVCSLFLILLGSRAGNDSDKKSGDYITETRDHHPHRNAHIHSSSHMHHIDPATIVFFLKEDLKQGNRISIHFPRRKLNDSFAHLLPKEKADAIPFSSHRLNTILHFFSFTPGSPQAKAIQDTLQECERPPIKGETKHCATSMESMMDFIKTILGSETEIESVSTIHLTASNTLLQKYTVEGIMRIPATRMVPCHTMPYPYAVFFCHYQESESRLLRVSLTGENGDMVEAIAICHMDTSLWSPTHVSFQVLEIEPGTSPVCHFLPADNFVWVPQTGIDVL